MNLKELLYKKTTTNNMIKVNKYNKKIEKVICKYFPEYNIKVEGRNDSTKVTFIKLRTAGTFYPYYTVTLYNGYFNFSHEILTGFDYKEIDLIEEKLLKLYNM